MEIPQGYKQTELGIIPEDWGIMQLRDIGTFSKGIGISRIESNSGNIPCIRYGEIYTAHDIYIKKFYSFVSKDIAKHSKLLKNGDILFAASGETKEDIGKCVAFISNCEAYAGGDIIILTPNINNFDGKYLGYILNTSKLSQQKASKGQGDAVVHITTESLSGLIVPLPATIEEQWRIAEVLSDVDTLIAALDKKIVKKRFIKQGAMHHFASKQLLNQKVKIGELGKWGKGQSFSKEQILPNGKYKCIHYGELFGYSEVIDKVKSTTNTQPIKKSSGRDILFPASDVTPIGLGRCSALRSNNILLGGDIIILELKSEYDPSYISYIINQNKQQIIDRVTGTTVKHINSRQLSEIIIEITRNRKEQMRIATILSDMDKEIAALEARRDKYKLIKSGMMQKLLTGQIRLTKSQAKVIPLATKIPATREIPVDAHIIAGHIVYRSYQSRGWGRTKLQKSLHLIGYSLQLKLGNEYIRNTAGPDDQLFMNYIDQKLKQYHHVDIVKKKLPDGRTHYTYIPTALIQDVEIAYERYPQDVREQIDALLDKLNTMDLAGAEILSTLYAVWNNRIIKGEPITDNLLISDFYAWSAHKADFEEIRVRKALDYMRKQNIIPIGWGKYIDKK